MPGGCERRAARLGRAFAVAVPFVGACSSSGGGGEGAVETQAMHLHASVQAADASRATVRVSLDNGEVFLTSTYILTGGDELRACVLGTCAALERVSMGLFAAVFPPNYAADLPYAPDADYVVSLIRSRGTGAPSSTVTLPPPFEVASPADGDRVTDGGVIDVIWSPINANERGRLEAHVRCEHSDGAITEMSGGVYDDADADGVIEVTVEQLLWNLACGGRSAAPLARCSLTLDVVHRRSGTIDAGYAGGWLHGAAVRSVTLEYTPAKP
jgi:hypothetical protein